MNLMFAFVPLPFLPVPGGAPLIFREPVQLFKQKYFRVRAALTNYCAEDEE